MYPDDDMKPPTDWVSKLTVFQLNKIAGAGFPIYTILAGIKNMAIQDVKEMAVLDGIGFDDFVFSVHIFFEMCEIQKVQEIRPVAKVKSGAIANNGNDIALGAAVEHGEFIVPKGAAHSEGSAPETCDKCGNNPAQGPHRCPYAYEIGDCEDTCNCCADCEYGCAGDV